MRPNTVRIIAGKYRSRKITFLPEVNLRPTPDRVKETLFNWLNPIIVGAKCLDLFAGSGALSIEAISRGAASVVAIEKNFKVIEQLQANRKLLKIDNLHLIHTDGMEYINSANRLIFDIIFLDPPYKDNRLPIILSKIIENKYLSKDGMIYFEADQNDLEKVIPSELYIVQHKKAGQVNFYLAKMI